MAQIYPLTNERTDAGSELSPSSSGSRKSRRLVKGCMNKRNGPVELGEGFVNESILGEKKCKEALELELKL